MKHAVIKTASGPGSSRAARRSFGVAVGHHVQMIGAKDERPGPASGTSPGPGTAPGAGIPGPAAPTATTPATSEPAVSEPANTEPASTEPASTEPASTEPASTKPGAVPGLPGSRPATGPGRALPRGRHDLPREFVARTQRDRLIDAMARTVAERGYAGTSLNDICSAAGVSTRAFYELFADKESCFLATFEMGVGLLQRSVHASYEQPGHWPDRMRRGLETLLQILAAEPAFAAFAMVEVLAAGPRAMQSRRELLDDYLRFFDEAPHPAALPTVPGVVAEAVVAGVYGIIHDYVESGRTAELPARLPELTYFVLSPFLGPAAAAAAGGLREPG
jgi:AcrR family transcriptional regulator